MVSTSGCGPENRSSILRHLTYDFFTEIFSMGSRLTASCFPSLFCCCPTTLLFVSLCQTSSFWFTECCRMHQSQNVLHVLTTFQQLQDIILHQPLGKLQKFEQSKHAMLALCDVSTTEKGQPGMCPVCLAFFLTMTPHCCSLESKKWSFLGKNVPQKFVVAADIAFPRDEMTCA